MTEKPKRRFALCIDDAGCEDLELRKVYAVLPDDRADTEGFVRVVDDSGEDYLYDATQFVFIDLPLAAERALAAHAGRVVVTPARGPARAPARR